MPTTYVQRSDTSDLSGGGEYSRQLVAGTATVSDLLIALAASQTKTGHSFTAAGVPGTSGVTGNYTVEVDIAIGDTSVMISVAVGRVNSAGTIQTESSFTAEQVAAGAVLTFNLTSVNLGTWAAGDRLRVAVRYRNSHSHTGRDVTVSFNTDESEVIAPWTAATPATVTPTAIAPTVSLPTPTTSVAAPATVTPAAINLADIPGYVLSVELDRAAVITADHASFGVTDLDIRFLLSLDDWTPTGATAAGGRDSSSPGQRSWRLRINTDGTMTLLWSVDGSGYIQKNSTAAVSFTNGTAHWLRCTLDVDNGATQNEVKFYTSDDPILTDPAAVTWTQLGATVTTAGTTSIFDGTLGIEMGGFGGIGMQGKLYYGEVRNGIGGTIVTSPDFRDADQITVPNTEFTDPQGRVWTFIAFNASWVPNSSGVRLPTPTIVVTNPPAVVTPAAIAPTVSLPTALPSVPIVVTPAAIAPTVSLPLPTAKAASTVTPAAIAPTVSLPTPATLAAAKVTPAAIAPSVSLPTPAIRVIAIVTPAAVAPVVSLPLPTAGVQAVVTPAAIAPTVSLPLPAAKAAALVAPVSIAPTVSLPTPTILAAARVTPAAIAPSVSLLTPSVLAASVVTPAAVTPTVSLPTPTIQAAATVTPNAVAPTVSLPTPTTITGAGSIVAPDAIAPTVALPTPTVSIPAAVTPDPVSPTVALPTATVTAGATVTPSAVAPAVTLPIPTILAGAGTTATPDVLAPSISLPTPSILAGAVVTPAAVVPVVTLPNPTAGVNAVVTPDVIAPTVSLPAPTILTAVVVSPNAIVLTIGLPTPSLIAESVVTPAVLALTITFPGPTIALGIVPFWLPNPAGYTTNGAAYVTAGAAYDPIRGDEDSPWN